jgi:peptidoglycan/xylan/chitin deacetylase (PgdA/CDA1 family)/uncharacterized protein YfiM (DUF2279 family)
MIMNDARRAVFAVSIALLAPIFYASAAFGPTIVENGNLETASSNPSIPQGWSTNKWGTITASFSYPVAGNGSAKAAKVQVTSRRSGDAKWFFAHVPVEGGKTYLFTTDYASNKATNITIEYKLTNGSLKYVWLDTLPSSGNVWKTYTKQFTAPTNAVSMTVLHTLGAVGVLTIDNVSVQKEGASDPPPPADTCPNVPGDQTTTPCADETCVQQGGTWNGSSCDMPPPPPTDVCPNVPGDQTTTPCADTTCVNQGGVWNGSSCDMPPPPPTENLVQNGAFETGGSTPQGWTSSKWGTHTATFTYPATGKSGRGAKLQVSNYRSGDSKWTFTPLAVSSHTIYEYKSDYASNAVSELNIEFKMSDGSYSYQWLANAPSTGGAWQSIRAEVTVPVGATEMTVFQALARNGTLTIDNVSLVPLSGAFPEGMVTFVFDDGLASQYQNARGILNAAGVKASFGIITSYVGSSPYMSWANLATLKNESHEISGHSRTHADLSTLSQSEVQNEVKGSYDDLVAQGFTPKTFLYPVGGVNPVVEQVTKDAGYIGSRGSYWGLNSPTANKYALYDIRLDKTMTLAATKAWIDQAYADKRWLIFELHDILPSGGDEYAISTSLLQSIVDYVKAKGIKVVTLEEGLQYMAP